MQGFSPTGNELYWTVTGDVVSALCIMDIDGDGRAELVVGSDDFDIRVFSGEDYSMEAVEADQFVALCPIHGNKFGYALVNGTIGVYDRMERAWRVKSKHSVCSITAYDLDGDGVPELISGWSNGRMEVRRDDTGEVVYRDHLTCAVSQVVKADYRNDGMEQVIACGFEGEVRGYMPVDPANQVSPEVDLSTLQQIIAELTQKKQELMYELSSYQACRNTDLQVSSDVVNMIPTSTLVDSFITINRDTRSCDLILKTNNETVIKGVVVFGEQIFHEESLFVCPKAPDSTLSVPLKPLKDVTVVLMIKVLVGTRTSTIYHVFELEIDLPKFAMYAPVERSFMALADSSVVFNVSERIPRIANWVETRFNMKAVVARADLLEVYFLCLRDQTSLSLKVVPTGGQAQVTIRTDSMEIAGEMIQDLASYLGLTDLASTADFPKAMEAFKEVLTKVEDYNATRLKLTADMADSSNLVKALVIKAEDARILGDMKAMRKYYRQLYDLNRDLIVEHEKRATNHRELLEALKEVNQMIQKAARLRCGAPKSKVVAACRNAIKANQMSSLFKIIKDGDMLP